MSEALAGNEFKELLQKYFDQRSEIEELEAQLKKLNENLNILQGKVLSLMDAMEITSFDLAGKKVLKVNKSSYKQPADKAALFEYLKQQDLLGLASVNSQTLNKLFRDKEQAAAEAGEFFELPDFMEKPSSYSILQVRKK